MLILRNSRSTSSTALSKVNVRTVPVVSASEKLNSLPNVLTPGPLNTARFGCPSVVNSPMVPAVGTTVTGSRSSTSRMPSLSSSMSSISLIPSSSESPSRNSRLIAVPSTFDRSSARDGVSVRLKSEVASTASTPSPMATFRFSSKTLNPSAASAPSKSSSRPSPSVSSNVALAVG